MIQITELDLKVSDVEEFNDRAGEILTDFCDTLTGDEYTRKVCKDNDEHWWAVEAGFEYLWTPKAQTLIEAEIDRLTLIGVKYFGVADVEVSSHAYCEE